MKFIVKEGLKLPNMGVVPARVSHIAESTHATYKTPQLEVTFVSTDPENPGSIRRWYNLLGYKTQVIDGKEQYIINKKTGLPEVSEEKTAKALNMLGTDAGRIGGFKAEDEINAEELVGCECAIAIEPNVNNKPQVSKVYSLQYYEENLAVEA
jgi:hypothetical protein